MSSFEEHYGSDTSVFFSFRRKLTGIECILKILKRTKQKDLFYTRERKVWNTIFSGLTCVGKDQN